MNKVTAFCYTTTELRYPSFTVERYDTFYVADVGQLPASVIVLLNGTETYDYLNENGFWESGFQAHSTEVPEDEQGEQDEVVTSFAWDIRD